MIRRGLLSVITALLQWEAAILVIERSVRSPHPFGWLLNGMAFMLVGMGVMYAWVLVERDVREEEQ